MVGADQQGPRLVRDLAVETADLVAAFDPKAKPEAQGDRGERGRERREQPVDLALDPETNPAREGLPPAMTWTILAGIAAFLLVFANFLVRRFEIARIEALEEGW